MENMKLYDSVRQVPIEAQKTINGGRLKGMTDINPQWRIQLLTEHFGPCGIGWKVVNRNKWIEDGTAGEKVAFVDIDLYIKVDGEWSEAIPGTGGSMLIVGEKNGLRTSDEAYKMATTDAISVACKMLGIGADIYWQAGRTKYSQNTAPEEKPVEKATTAQIKTIHKLCDEHNINHKALLDRYKLTDETMTAEQAGYILAKIKQSLPQVS